MAGKENQKRRNINFRQTPKEFKSAKQNQTYHHIKTNIPYSLLVFAGEKINIAINRFRNNIRSMNIKLPKDAKKIK